MDYWQKWSSECKYNVPFKERVLKRSYFQMSHHAETGGIVATATTLPEEIGEVHNWDYRYSSPAMGR